MVDGWAGCISPGAVQGLRVVVAAGRDISRHLHGCVDCRHNEEVWADVFSALARAV